MMNFRTSKISNAVRVSLVRETEIDTRTVMGPENIRELWDTTVASRDEFDPDKETFVVFLLDAKAKVRHVDVVSVGTMDASLVHPREVFRKAVAMGAHSLVLAHNHPSGDPNPSPEDLRITRQLVEAGKVLHIEVRDHVVVGESRGGSDDYVSLRECGLIVF